MFVVLIFGLFLSQLFIIKPGTDLMGIHTPVQTITAIGGLTYSAIICIIIILYCIVKFLMSNRMCRSDVRLLLMLAIYTILGIAMGMQSGLLSVDDGIKMIFPFVIFLYLGSARKLLSADVLRRLVLTINVLLIVQVFVCKLIEGRFSASTYYWYVYDEEYFGFFNSPHPFAANLGLLIIWNFLGIHKKQHVKLNGILLIFNLWLIYRSGVKTYLLACLMVVALIVFHYAFTRRPTPLTKLSWMIILLGVLSSQFLINMFLNSRFSATTNTVELSSGRYMRWFLDIQYYLTDYNAFEVLFGRGFGAIYKINKSVIGVEINSLNAVLDILMDNGLTGLVLIICCYVGMIRRLISRENLFFAICLGLYLLIGIMINNILPYVTVMSLSVIILHTMKTEALARINPL